MKKILFLSLIVSISINLFAQSNIYPSKGNWEFCGYISFNTTQEYYARYGISVNGNYVYEAENYLFTISINPTIGYFLNDYLQLKAETGLNNMSNDFGNSTSANISVGPEFDFKLENQPLIPYLGGNLGYVFSSYHSDIIWKIMGGMKINLTGNALLDVGAYYSRMHRDTHPAYSIGTFSIKAGIGFFL